MRLKLLLAVTIGLTGGCYKQEFVTSAAGGGAVQTEKVPFYIYGLIGEHTVNVKQLCPQGVARFNNQLTVGNAICAGCTGGLYAPITVEVECSGGSSYLLTPDAENGVTWVDPVEGGTQ